MKPSSNTNLTKRGVIARMTSIGLACLLPQIASAADELRVTTDSTSTVQVYLTVKSGSGTAIGGLQQDAFQLLEKGATQTINDFASLKDLPVTTVFVMDYSRSNESSVPQMQDAVKGFIDLMDSEDEAAIVTFNGTVTLNQDLTTDHALLKTAAEAGTVGSYSQLYAAIDKAIDVVKASHNTLGTHTIVVLSDGYNVKDPDNTTPTLTLAELSDHLANVSVSLFPIGYGADINTQTLLNLATGTGGYYYDAATDSARFSDIFTEISDRLNNEYRLTYTTAISACGSNTININVDTDEGTKSYTGTFDKCASVDPDTSTSSSHKKGGGSLDLATLLAGVLSLSIVRRTRRKDSSQA